MGQKIHRLEAHREKVWVDVSKGVQEGAGGFRVLENNGARVPYFTPINNILKMGFFTDSFIDAGTIPQQLPPDSSTDAGAIP